MDRVAKLKAFDTAGHYKSKVFFNALVGCLTAEEACRALAALYQVYAKRVPLVRRICTDIHKRTLKCHRELVGDLSARLSVLSGRERAICANVLLELADALPLSTIDQILESLVESPNGNIRRQVYRRIKRRPESEFPSLLLVAWEQHRDFEAARLIVDRAPRSVLESIFLDLEAAVKQEGWLLARLYLRLQGQAPADLGRLKEIDPISHAYVCVKLQKTVPAWDLVRLYRDRMLSERGGLIVWCAGQMGYWSAIVKMQKLRENPPAPVLATYYRSWGIDPKSLTVLRREGK